MDVLGGLVIKSAIAFNISINKNKRSEYYLDTSEQPVKKCVL